MSLSLTVLGTSTPYPRPDRPCSGYLLRTPEAAVALDLGPGTLANLQREVPLSRLSAVWVSHLHADHTADLLSLYYALSFGDLDPPGPIPVYAPPGLGSRLAGFFQQPDTEFLAEAFTLHALRDGHTVQVGGLEMTCRAVEHGIEAYALRARYGGATLAYSGDCAPCPGLDAVAEHADVLLCETGFDRWPTRGWPRVHHTPEDAGALAARAGVGTLLVTHVNGALPPEAAVRRAGAAFGGATTGAQEGRRYRIESPAPHPKPGGRQDGMD